MAENNSLRKSKHAVQNTGEIDYILLGVMLIFYGLGLVMVYSASIGEGIGFGDPAYFFKRQLIWTAVSYIAFVAFIFIDYTRVEKYMKLMVWGIILLLLVLLFPPLIKAGLVHYSRRWFRLLHMGFQPSEFAKIVLIFYLAFILSKKGDQINDFYRGFLPPFLIISVISFLVFLEPDFSTAFMLFFISIMMFFIAGIRTSSIVSLIVVSIPALFLMINEKSYRRERIMGFLNPWADPTDKGYQIIQSYKAFAYGGLLGAGLGRSVQKMKYLPVPYSDFILAIFAEEMGYVGMMVVICLYMVLAYRGFKIAYSRKVSMDFYLAFGITSLITCEAVFNIAVVTGLLPSTGISPPFLSYGGSNLLSKSILVGLLLNISRKSGAPQNHKNLVWDHD
ncbi:MAG: putative lipid II flippase FtsW [Spirochaetota bacterium]